MIYFIKPVGMDGPIKIGCSTWPPQRLAAILTWSPFDLEIVAEINGHWQTERRFHARFIRQHERNEWFSWSSELQETIDAIRDGSFNVAELPHVTGCPCRWSEKRIAKTMAEAA